MSTEIIYKTTIIPTFEQIAALYLESGLKRPVEEKERIEKMFFNSNLIITAWHNESLVGISRAMSDGGYWCYLADLAVDPKYQKMGIGRHLITETKFKAGKDCSLIWLSSPDAISYYHKIGIKNLKNAFGIDRESTI